MLIIALLCHIKLKRKKTIMKSINVCAIVIKIKGWGT